jgi:methylglutaconyl-CoA hydratase
MSDRTDLLLEQHDHIVTITLNRPHVCNALNDNIINLLTHYLTQIDGDPNVSAVILRANGDHFCAGADIESMRKSAALSKEKNKKNALLFANCLKRLANLNKPTICIIQGNTVGGGIGLIACCDIAIALDNAMFSFSEVKLGLVPAIISPYIINAIGQRAALYYFLTCDHFPAKQAKSLGLIHEISDAKKIQPRLDYLLNAIKGYSQNALKNVKKLVHQQTPSLAAMEIEKLATLIATHRSSLEGKEGLAAFLEKRAPSWQSGNKKL